MNDLRALILFDHVFIFGLSLFQSLAALYQLLFFAFNHIFDMIDLQPSIVHTIFDGASIVA